MKRFLGGLALALLVLGIIIGTGLHLREREHQDQVSHPTPVSRTHEPARGVRARAVEHYVALGDSVAKGTACSCDPFLAVAAQERADTSGRPVVSQNAGADGLTSQELVDQLSTRHLQPVLQDATVVLVSIGANDVDTSWFDAPAAHQEEIDAIGERLEVALTQLRRQAPGAQVLVLGYWNVGRDGEAARADQGRYQGSLEVTRRVNSQLEARARHAGMGFLDLTPVLKGEDGQASPEPYLALDGEHPNAEGHARIGSAVHTLLVRAAGQSSRAATSSASAG